ncbi:MAG TPA: exosortase A [Candidatus Accumulibacter phosphatis]|nr:MAG: exosortase A [Candidatus Accumulibacter sp. SK-11]HAY29393.1 exosortase A [Accumulibacter sp.]HRL75738.1 exosortase A [Candidatus Accumulibacter phosphatis]HCN70134.1 exosortase A [Accumulibacter sp.]HCV12869.1 exosortase A [Accumulibacter sp.]
MIPRETSSAAAATDSGWRTAGPVLAVVVLIILALFSETALDMASIWWRSDTYAHGMIVPPIALWLAWRLRAGLSALSPRASYLAVVLLGGAGSAWLLGQVAAVNALSQFALVTMLVLAVPAVVGWQVTRLLAFPLLFLFFAVPFGDFTQPKLMEWTADATVAGLRLSGIPVYREGQHLVIPSGNWAVVEACSGVRYLIASITVGTLYAYLTYRTLWRRLLFVLVSIIVPVLANWGRAYMIVMLGHLSGNKLAVGVDHLVYGWVFFGIVILAMFWVGARWREDEVLPQQATAVVPATGSRASPAALLAAAVATVLVAGFWPLALWQLDHAAAREVKGLAPLGQIAGWQPSDAGSPYDWQPRFAGDDARRQAVFLKDGQRVGLFVAYYRHQDQQRKLVSSTNVLVASEDPVWARVAGGAKEMSFNQQPLRIRTAELRGLESTRLLVWQWYWINGRWTSSEAVAKGYTALSRLSGQGDDSAVILLFAQQGRPGEADAALADFATAAGAAIESALRQTAGER